MYLYSIYSFLRYITKLVFLYIVMTLYTLLDTIYIYSTPAIYTLYNFVLS